MSWWGKLLGGALGFMLGGPLGALLGAALGHNFDKGLAADRLGGPGVDTERVQAAFFTAVFAVMGHLAKADGRVSRDEIGMAESVMARMNLAPDMRAAAIRLFNEGKAADFPLEEVIGQLRRECHQRRHLFRMFMEILLHAAWADGRMHPAEAAVLERVRQLLGMSLAEFRQIDAMVRAARFFAGGAAGGPAPEAASGRGLQEAYQVLGVGPEASDEEVKKAYRRLMHQHHPDKLVAKGLPEEMVRLATEKTQEIKSAYETIRRARRAAG